MPDLRSRGPGFAADPDLLAQGIRVNTVSFGAVTTPMTGAELAIDGGLAQI